MIRADATASCVNGVPTPQGSTSLASLTLNGNPIPPSQPGVISSNPQFYVEANEKTTLSSDGGQTLRVRALHVFIGGNGGSAEFVFGEAKAGWHGDGTQLPGRLDLRRDPQRVRRHRHADEQQHERERERDPGAVPAELDP